MLAHMPQQAAFSTYAHHAPAASLFALHRCHKWRLQMYHLDDFPCPLLAGVLLLGFAAALFALRLGQSHRPLERRVSQRYRGRCGICKQRQDCHFADAAAADACLAILGKAAEAGLLGHAGHLAQPICCTPVALRFGVLQGVQMCDVLHVY